MYGLRGRRRHIYTNIYTSANRPDTGPDTRLDRRAHRRADGGADNDADSDNWHISILLFLRYVVSPNANSYTLSLDMHLFACRTPPASCVSK